MFVHFSRSHFELALIGGRGGEESETKTLVYFNSMNKKDNKKAV